jgi:hypothetical protein
MLIQLHVFAAATIGLPAGDGDGVGVGVAVGRSVGVGLGVGVAVGLALGRAVAVAVAVGLAVGLGVGVTPGLVDPRGLGVGLGPTEGVAVGAPTGTVTELAVPPFPLQAAVAAAAPTKSSAKTAILPRMHHPLRRGAVDPPFIDSVFWRVVSTGDFPKPRAAGAASLPILPAAPRRRRYQRLRASPARDSRRPQIVRPTTGATR